MKRLISVFLIITILLSFCACGKKENTPVADTSTQNTEFTAPENYTSVLLVTINPQFKLYLDENNNVLAVEPVNDDAKTFVSEIDFQNRSFETVVGNILEKANEKGFVKENATVNFEFAEQKSDSENAEDVLQKAAVAAENKANELLIVIVTETKKITQPTSPETPNVESESSDVNQNRNNIHKHSFSAATCTEREKCSCGAVGGSALGHNYDNGKCTRCSAQDPNFSFTSVSEKKGTWRLSDFIGSDGDLYRIVFSLQKGNVACPFEAASPLQKLPADIQDKIRKEEKENIVVFANEEFYFNRGSVFDITVAEEKNTLKITSQYGGKIVLSRLDENTMAISESDGAFYWTSNCNLPVGLKLTFENS